MREIQEARFNLDSNQISVMLPLTQPTGKIRVKERNSFYEYGLPVAVRQTPLTLRHYVEWQIGYDLLNNEENRNKTLLSDKIFSNNKGESKLPYELAEILYYSYRRNLISIDRINDTFNQIVHTERTLDVMEEMQISRTNPIQVNINSVDFYKMHISYPLLVHRFGQYDIYAEIAIKEKQRAVGVQPMLYVCLPLSSLTFEQNYQGRILNPKECAKWIISSDEAKLSLELFRIFGMLSEKHKFDVSQILRTLFQL